MTASQMAGLPKPQIIEAATPTATLPLIFLPTLLSLSLPHPLPPVLHENSPITQARMCTHADTLSCVHDPT